MKNPNKDSRFRTQVPTLPFGLHYKVQGLGFWVLGFGFRVPTLPFLGFITRGFMWEIPILSFAYATLGGSWDVVS